MQGAGCEAGGAADLIDRAVQSWPIQPDGHSKFAIYLIADCARITWASGLFVFKSDRQTD